MCHVGKKKQQPNPSLKITTHKHTLNSRAERITSHTCSKLKGTTEIHYTPEHCLVNGGVPLFWWKRPCFKWAKWRSFKGPCTKPQTFQYPKGAHRPPIRAGPSPCWRGPRGAAASARRWSSPGPWRKPPASGLARGKTLAGWPGKEKTAVGQK